MSGLTSVWNIARWEIGRAQKKQKTQYDRKTKTPHYRVGDRVMVFMPHVAKSKDRKLALPHHDPFRIVNVTSNDLSVCQVDHPDEEPILVSMDRVTLCPEELPDVSWLGTKHQRSHAKKNTKPAPTPPRTTRRYDLRSGCARGRTQDSGEGDVTRLEPSWLEPS